MKIEYVRIIRGTSREEFEAEIMEEVTWQQNMGRKTCVQYQPVEVTKKDKGELVFTALLTAGQSYA